MKPSLLCKRRKQRVPGELHGCDVALSAGPKPQTDCLKTELWVPTGNKHLIRASFCAPTTWQELKASDCNEILPFVFMCSAQALCF